MEKIQVARGGPVWGVASATPFGLKLETWLRMVGIPYTGFTLTRPPQSKTGKIPYIVRGDGSILADSSIIIETLAAEHGVELLIAERPEDRAQAHLVLRTLEESLYFALAWERWFDPRFWPITRDAYLEALPGPMRPLVAAMLRAKVRRILHGQGIGRHEPERIITLGQTDVMAIAAALGERPYFAGQRPGLVDASAYGTFANLLAFPAQTPLQAAVEERPNLVDFCRRMKTAFWNDSRVPEMRQAG